MSLAKSLRKRTTSTEKILWEKLRAKRFHNLKFKRQSPIGPYIADFLCIEKKLVIEVDGYSHILREKEDVARDAFLGEAGFSVLRFSNAEVKNALDFVLQRIYFATQTGLVPSSSLEGEGQGEGGLNGSNSDSEPDTIRA